MRTLLIFFLGTTLLAAQSASDLLDQARALDRANQNREALPLLLKANSRQPGNGAILQLIAKQYSQLILETSSKKEKKRLGQEALAYARQAVKVEPDNSDAHLSLAVIFGRIAQSASPKRKIELSKRIRDEATRAARLDPQSDFAWHILGRWNYEMANLNPILKAIGQAFYGKFPAASNAEAVKDFQKAIAIAPQRAIHHVELGRTYLAMGEKNKARQELQKGLALPSNEKDAAATKERARRALRQLD